MLFGGSGDIEAAVYLIVGLAAIWTIYLGGKIAGFVEPMVETDTQD